MNLPDLSKTPAGYNDGLKAAAHRIQPECPFKPGSPSAKNWSDGLIDGNTNIAWNIRSVIHTGQSCRWLSEALSMQIAMSVGKSMIGLGAEMLVCFRVGFIVCDQNAQIPVLNVNQWKSFANIVRGTLIGELIDVASQNPTNFELLGWETARSFIEELNGGRPVAQANGRFQPIEVETIRVLQWMGGTVEDRNLRI